MKRDNGLAFTLVFPFIVFNFVGGPIAGIWLAILGRWADIFYGIGLMIAGGYIIGIAMMPGLIFSAPIVFLQRRKMQFMSLSVSFLASLYSMAVLACWCSLIFLFFNGRAIQSGWRIPMLIWSYLVATTPIFYLTKNEKDNPYTLVSSIFAQFGYMFSAVVFWLASTSVVVPVYIITGSMLVAALAQLVMAYKEHYAQ